MTSHALCDQCPLNGQPLVHPHWQNMPEWWSLGDTDMGGIMVVGEAPGVTEAKKGEPFIGKSGELLEIEMRRAGLSKDDAWLTNAVMCWPPGNKMKNYPKAVPCCRPRLIGEIRAVQPSLIIGLGNTAKNTLLPHFKDNGITSLRGKTYESDELPCPVYLTVHPAAVLHNASYALALRQDLQNVYAKRAKIPPTKIIELKTVKDVGRLLDAFMQLPKGTRVALDTETSNLLPHKARLLCIQLTYRKGRSVVIPGDILNEGWVKAYLNKIFAMDMDWVGTNFAFDYRHLMHKGFYPPRVWTDAFLLHYLTNENRGGHGLKDMGASLLGAEDWESDIKKWVKKKTDSYALIPWPKLREYAARDTDINWRIMPAVVSMVEAKCMRAYNNVLKPAQRMLAETELRGMQIDVPRLNELLAEQTHIRASIEKHMENLTWPGFNPRSTQQVGKILYDDMGMKCTVKTAKGGRSTNEEALTKLLRRHPDNTFLRLMMEHRSVQKIISTYLEGLLDLLDKDDVYHPDFNMGATVTGRLTAGIALTIPRVTKNKYAKYIRDLFIARPGYKLVGADYSQAELRVMASEAQETVWQKIWAEDRDLHGEMATLLFGEGWGHEERMLAKMFTFGLAYGRGPKSISEQTGWPLSKAQSFHRKYMDAIPRIKEWQEGIKRQAKGTGVLTSPFGRKRRFPLWTKKNYFHQMNEALNFIPQSTASDLTLMTMTLFHDDPVWKVKAHNLLMLHDGFYVECKEDRAEICAQYIKEQMEEVPRRFYSDFVHFKVDIKVGSSWGAMEREKDD